MLRIPHCLHNRLTDGGEVVSPMHRPRSTPQKHDFPALLKAWQHSHGCSSAYDIDTHNADQSTPQPQQRRLEIQHERSSDSGTPVARRAQCYSGLPANRGLRLHRCDTQSCLRQAWLIYSFQSILGFHSNGLSSDTRNTLRDRKSSRSRRNEERTSASTTRILSVL
jgi:hypothetical protein